METQLIKKLSSKSIISSVKQIALDHFYLMGDLEKPNPDAPKKVELYRILGVCQGIKTGAGDNGDWVSFEGNFKAVTSPIGDEESEVFRAPRAFLSEPASSMLVMALESGDTIELAFVVSIIPAKNAYGYEYRTSPLLPIQESDAILALEQKLQGLETSKNRRLEPQLKMKKKKKTKK